MIDIAAFENAVQAWAAAVLNPVEVIFAEQDETRPDTPYVTIKLNSVQLAGHDHESQPDATDQQTITGPRILVTEFQAMGSNALSLLEQLKSSLQKISTVELLGASNISIFNSNEINDITVALETKFERRGTFEVRFAVGSSESDTVDIVETVNIDATYKDPADNTILDSTISIN